MISMDFVQTGYQYYPEEALEFDQFLEDANDEFNHIISSMNLGKESSEFDALFGESFLNDEEVMTEEAKIVTAIKALGEFIKKIFNKVIEKIKLVIDKLRDASFKMKNVEKKMDELLKKHPDAKDKKAFLYNNIRFEDIKNITELEKEYKRCMAMIDANENPKSIKAKWRKAWQKYVDDSGGVGNAAIKIARDAAVVVSLATSILKLKDMIGKGKKTNETLSDKTEEIKYMTEKKITKFEKITTGTDAFGSKFKSVETRYESASAETNGSVFYEGSKLSPQDSSEYISLIHEMYGQQQQAIVQESAIRNQMITQAMRDTAAAMHEVAHNSAISMHNQAMEM